jgi:hypothetical protein
MVLAFMRDRRANACPARSDDVGSVYLPCPAVLIERPSRAAEGPRVGILVSLPLCFQLPSNYLAILKIAQLAR